MTIHLGNVPASTTLYIPFATYDANGASVTMSGFATSDILIYKNGSVTQRSSTAGFTLLDTDGIDFDSVTGLHGFSVDLSDNTDAGFYAVGSFYWVVVSTITVSAQTVTALAATFRLVSAEGVTGQPKVDVAAYGGAAGTFASGRPEVNTTHIAGSAVSTSTAQLGVNVVNFGGSAGTFASGRPETNTTHWRGTAVAVPAVAGVPSVDAISVGGSSPASTADVATGVWQDATAGDFTAASSIGKALFTGVVPGASGGLFIAGTNAATTVTTALTTTFTGNLTGSVGSVTGAVGSVTGAVGSVTANVNADIKKVNGTTVTGNGQAGTEWGP